MRREGMASHARIWRLLVGVTVAAGLLGAACAKGTQASSGSPPPSTPTGSTNTSGSSGGRYGSGRTSPAPPNTVQQGAGGFVFNPSTITVKEGKIITVTNVGSTDHTFTVVGKNIDIVNAPGASKKVTIDLKPGTYSFICRFHVNFGMKGTLVVTD